MTPVIVEIEQPQYGWIARKPKQMLKFERDTTIKKQQ